MSRRLYANPDTPAAALPLFALPFAALRVATLPSAALRLATLLALTVSLGLAPAQAGRHRGPVPDAAGRYSAVFPLSQARPNPSLTPGAVDPRVTQENIRETICVRGYTKTIRPPVSYTEPLKRRQIAEYGYQDRRVRDYEEDHLIPLELGGAPADPGNLWPQPHHVVGGWGSYAKDRLENRLHALVCRGRLPLATAQTAIAADWIAAYRKYVGERPDNRRVR